ncbi:uncharacterized protein LOC125469785 [Pyrus x bretschneideri]|uniref:uncharacterized protein LOC125469785 n=1 Tax=Pyrus x bretschneideri TaxID=225117 RepID=UPI00202F8939|nr:uncharacterized protein LOC125469785 [Pyrus x bretschneideri]
MLKLIKIEPPRRWELQFQSWKAFDNATRVISRKGRLYKLERANRSQWDNLTSHDGKTSMRVQFASLKLSIPPTFLPELGFDHHVHLHIEPAMKGQLCPWHGQALPWSRTGECLDHL